METSDLVGTVTSVNTTFACFEIDGIVKVHMSKILAQGKLKKLPLIGSKIVIKNGYKFKSTYVVCESSIIQGNFQTDCPWNTFLNLINTYKLGSDDIVKFEEISNEIENHFTNLKIELKNDMLLSLLQKLILLIIGNGDVIFRKGNYNNSILIKVSLTFVRTCKYVEIISNKYAKFPYWSFGSHPSVKNRILFGYLEIHPFYGFYMLKDSDYQLACVVITENCKKTDIEISHLQNSYVLIEKYTVMTEIFKDNAVPNVEYVIAKVDDIHVVHSRSENNIFGIKSDELKYSNVISFVLLKKSTVYMNTRNLPELVLHVFIQYNSTELFSKDVYLVLSSKYISLNLHLKEGLSYRMFFETLLNTVKRPALTRIKDLNIYEISHQGCFFQPVNVEVRNISEPLSIPKCMSHIQNCSDLVTFRGDIKIKRFTDPLPSTTVKIPAIYGFETPGKKVHQLVFSHVDGNRRVFLDCYLSNWHNMLMPLGLVPEMEVIVRHVIPQSKKYLRSTIFTSFEVVSYKPSISFNSVNLYNQFDWGMPVFLSQGKKVPVDVLVWGHVYSIFLLKLSIISECTKCKQTVIGPNSCSSCHETERELKFVAKFNALDQYGQSSVMTKSLEVLQVLLNLNSTVFKEWVAIFHHIGPYSYNFFDGSTPIYEDFTKYLEKIGDRKVLLDLKCRKVADSSSQDTRRASWYCVEARKR